MVKNQMTVTAMQNLLAETQAQAPASSEQYLELQEKTAKAKEKRMWEYIRSEDEAIAMGNVDIGEAATAANRANLKRGTDRREARSKGAQDQLKRFGLGEPMPARGAPQQPRSAQATLFAAVNEIIEYNREGGDFDVT